MITGLLNITKCKEMTAMLATVPRSIVCLNIYRLVLLLVIETVVIILWKFIVHYETLIFILIIYFRYKKEQQIRPIL